MDYVMRRRSTVGGALEMFSLPLPFTSKFRQATICTKLQFSQISY